MGNQVSHGSTRVILSDGTVTEYNEPVTVAELMLDHPQQVVVEFQPVAKRPKPLAADFRLENNKVYLMSPMRRGKPVVANMLSEEQRRILLRADAVLKSGLFVSAYTGVIPVFVKMWPTAVIKSKNKEKVAEKSSTVTTKSRLFTGVELALEGRDDYHLKKSWKPSLDTIKEKGVKAKMIHRLR